VPFAPGPLGITTQLMTQVLERPLSTRPTQSTGANFYLLAVTRSPTLYWGSQVWNHSKLWVQAFPSFEAAEMAQPQAVKKVPVGYTVIISSQLL